MASPAFRAVSRTGGANVNTRSPGKPTGTVDDDGMLAFAYIETSQNPVTGMTPPLGWTQVVDQFNNAVGGKEFHLICWKKLAASEGASWAWNWTNATWNEFTVVSYPGVLTSEIVDSFGHGTNASGTASADCGNITTLSANTMLVAFYANFDGSGSNWTPPTGFTERADEAASSAGASGLSEKAQAAAGATGSVTATASNTGPVVGLLIALASEAATGGGGPTTPAARMSLLGVGF